jgi:hypothetical protein
MILINNDKAIEVAKNKIRVWREAEFKKNDLAIQNALVDGSDMTALVARRDYLRDMTTVCNGKSIEELITIIDRLGE